MIPLVKPYLPDPDILMPEIESVLYSGYIAEGESVYEFERQFGDFIQNNKTLAVCSGTAALHLALLMLGVGEGDEVISTALTAEPTNTTIALTGAKVVWADIEPDTGLSSPESVKALISERTKAIMLVHYAGMVCDMDKFTALARDSGVPIIEDAAHALGARYAGKPVGCHSPYTAFSFQAIKHMTTVDGGALALGAGQSLEPVRRLRWFGLDKFAPRLSNNIVRAGYKYNMNNVTAVIGLCQLRDVERIISRHILNGKCYDNELRDIPGVSLLRYSDNTEPSYWLYTMKVTQRCDFIQAMESRGVAVSPLHLRNDRHEVFAGSKCELPVLDTFYDEFVHIPCGWWVGNEERDLIVQAIKKGW
jgi:dTDP-4-amino-4,6-dideoxygalactose transaminase